jgi:circadian clock protein KaiB
MSAKGHVGGPDKDMIVLRMYVAGNMPNSVTALACLRAAVAGVPGVQVDVVDTFSDPDIVLRDRITATPTLVRLQPTPQIRLIGAITDTTKLRVAIGLSASETK